MPNIRLDKQTFPFFDSVNNPVTEVGASGSFRNHCYANMVLEISGVTAADIVVEGCINILEKDNSLKSDEDCQWTPLAILNNSDYGMSTKITSNGIYTVSIEGLSRVRVNIRSISGQGTIIGVMGA